MMKVKPQEGEYPEIAEVDPNGRYGRYNEIWYIRKNMMNWWIYTLLECVLEMITFEYPYSECTHPAQIYRKVISGTKPEALYKIKDEETRQFVEKCLVTASDRLSALELLKHPSLHIVDLAPAISNGDIVGMRHHENGSLTSGGFSNGHWIEPHSEHSDGELEIHGLELFCNQEGEHFANMDISIKGRRKEDGGVFVRLKITDKDGRVRNISFPFDVEVDTALSVAAEMVAELDITDYEVTRIAEMIEDEISNLVPGWKADLGIDDSPRFSSKNLCRNCTSNTSSSGSLQDYISFKGPDCENLQKFSCSNLEHGRFEEITYQIERSENYHEGDQLFSSSKMDAQNMRRKKIADELWDLNMNSENKHRQEISNFTDEHGDEIQHELRWLREYKSQISDLYSSSDQTNMDQKMEDD